ncbi:MAG: energy transducer TonB [Planctomycetes bacterium]|nr:energy transducer TonB [Planctomycetota bacterium]
MEPTYPPEAGGDSALVVLDILIADDGRPEVIEVFEGEEPLAAAAVAAAQQYVFYPAERKNGERPFVWVELAMPVVPPAGHKAVETASAEPIQVSSATPDPADSTAAVEDADEGSRE